MQPCIATVWQVGAGEPGLDRLPLDRELVLDGELFGDRDHSISSAANAPRLISISSRRVRLVIPAHCATGAVVVQHMNFDALHRRISSGQVGDPRTHAAELGRSLLVARGPHSALALLRAASREPHRSDSRGRDAYRAARLVTLPPTVKVLGPTEIELVAPAIVIVGSGAVAIAPGITVFPDSGVNIVDHCRRLHLPNMGGISNLEHHLAPLDRDEPSGQLRVAGHPEAIWVADLPQVAKAVLDRVSQNAWFAPALVDDREARLCLYYTRADGSAAGILSPSDIPSWLTQLHALGEAPKASVCSHAPQSSSGCPVLTRVPARTSSPTRSAEIRAPEASVTLPAPVHFGELQTHYAQFGKALCYLESMRNVDLGVLLLGESGTGKEHLAREIHARSKRCSGPFHAINISSLTDTLIENDLFGHIKGAFTGTHNCRDGAFVTAHGGTLLLDEIADAPLRVQLALLRVLETRMIRPMGADRERAVDVRVIAATSRDLVQLVSEGKFREDLYHRIAETTLVLPPLRERPLDLEHIASLLLTSLKCPLNLTADALVLLQQQPWSGNVRGLRSALRQVVQLAEGSKAIGAEHIALLPSLEPLGAAVAAPAPATPVSFPADVRNLGEALWRGGKLPLQSVSGYERRAFHRAALIYLAVERGKNALTAALLAQWARLFGERWSQTENQRGLRDVMRLLGATARNDAARRWLLGIVET